MTDLTNQLLDEEEGPHSPTAYKDSRGLLTISRGCLIDPSVRGAGLCAAAMAAQDAHDVAQATAIAQHLPHFADVGEIRQAVLISMTFQMGYGPLKWPKFVAALSALDYAAASVAGLDSEWARQTPARAAREMAMLESGIWKPKSP